MSTLSSNELPRIFLAQVMGGDSPIPYLFEKIAFHLKDRYHFTIMSDSRYPRIDHPNVDEIYVGPPQSARRVLRRLRTAWQAYDVVHTTANMRFNSLMAKMARNANRDVRHVHTFRLDEDPNHPDSRSRAMGEMADVLTAVSQHTAQTIREAMGREPYVIYNGVDANVFTGTSERPIAIDQWGISSPYFLFIGSLEQRKRPHLIVEIARRVPNANFIIIGDGPLKEDLEYRAKGLPNAIFAGKVPKHSIPGFMSHARALVFPSVREGCPNVVLEAMACGTPVIGVAATSLPEIIRDEETGFLAESDNAGNLAECAQLIMDEKKSRELGRAAREYIHTFHNFEVISRQYGKLYDQVLLSC